MRNTIYTIFHNHLRFQFLQHLDVRHPARNTTHSDRVARTLSQKITVEHFSGADRAATGLQATYGKNYFCVMSINSLKKLTISSSVRKLVSKMRVPGIIARDMRPAAFGGVRVGVSGHFPQQPKVGTSALRNVFSDRSPGGCDASSKRTVQNGASRCGRAGRSCHSRRPRPMSGLPLCAASPRWIDARFGRRDCARP